MKIKKCFLLSLLFCLSLIGCFAAHASPSVPGMGQVYFVYDLGNYNPNAPVSSTNNWYNPGENFKTPVGLYQINVNEVNTQIANMRSSGMDYIVLHIAMTDLSTCKSNGSCNDGFPQNWVWGELVDDSQYALRSMQASNLTNILNAIRTNGFRKVIIRFANYEVGSSPTLNETQYQKAWNVIANTHGLVAKTLAGSLTSAIYDLGVENLGATNAQSYVQRLWSDYTYTFGTSDTLGFSTIADNYHLAGLSWYGSLKPTMYAFDVYGDPDASSTDVGAGLVRAWKALNAAGEGAKPIIVLETFQNDPVTASQIQSAMAANPTMHITAVTQWPTTRQAPCSGCDTNIRLSAIQSLNTTTQLSNVGTLPSRVVSDNSNLSLMLFSDVNCASTTTATCTLQGNFAYSPTSGTTAYQVYVSGANGVRQLMDCEGIANRPTVNWIKRNYTYKFEYIRVANCSVTYSGQTPDATSIVSVR